MTAYSDWIQGDDGTAEAFASEVNSARWQREYFDTPALDAGAVLDASWGTYDDTYPGPEPTPVPPFAAPGSTFANLGNESGGLYGLIDFRPVVHEYLLPTSALSSATFTPPDIPQSEWEPGATGFEWETPYVTWTQVDYTVRAVYGRTGSHNTASGAALTHPCHLLQAPAGWLPATPTGADYPRRSSDYSAWTERHEAAIAPTAFTGLWPVVEWGQSGSDVTLMPAPAYVKDGSGHVSGQFGFSINAVSALRTYRPPRHRWVFDPQGMWSLRQRQTLTGNAGGWPLRQRNNGAASGSWPLRQRHADN